METLLNATLFILLPVAILAYLAFKHKRNMWLTMGGLLGLITLMAVAYIIMLIITDFVLETLILLLACSLYIALLDMNRNKREFRIVLVVMAFSAIMTVLRFLAIR